MSAASIFIIIIIFTSVIVVNGQRNCSSSNPCGSNGYCRQADDGTLTCECKFWWNGTYCDVQTNSGKQVIILGCLLGFLLAAFYGLALFRYVRERRRKPKEEKQKEIVEYPKLFDVALKTARRTARLSSLLTVILTVILAGGALVAKWSIIQPIHDELVYKCQTNQTLYYVQNSFCKIIKLERFNLITFPVACLLILIFIIRTKRTSLLHDKCYGYGAPPMPADFLSHTDRKFTALVFAICADELLSIMQAAFNGSTTKSEGVVVDYLIRLFQVLIMGFRYYPFLAAVYINSILTLSCASLYAWLDYSITIVNQGMCQPDFYQSYDEYQVYNTTNVDTMFEYYGTGPTLVAIQLCTDIPRFLCLAYINVKLPLLLIDKIYYRFKKDISPEKRMLMKLTREQRILFRISRPNSVEMLYVKNLFRSPNQRPKSHALFARLIPKIIYEWRDDFRFSARVLSVYSSIFLLLYFAAIQACVRVIPFLGSLQKTLQQLLDVTTKIIIPTDGNANSGDGLIDSDTSSFPLPALVRPYLIAIFMTLIIIVIQLLVLLVNIRRNLFQVYRGIDSEIPRRQRSNYISLSSGNIHFAGYFIGYLIWGFILIAIFSAVISISIEAFVTFGNVRLIEKILKFAIPSILFILFKEYLNRLLAQYVFLQHYGEVLSLNNRRILMIFIYFNFFLDAFVGFISSIFRLITSFLGGIIYMCRLDYSPLGRKLETMDGGFSAYCGFIHTECVHRHPVMLVFASHLYTQFKIKQLINQRKIFYHASLEHKYRIQLIPSSRYIRKWKLAAFLIRNPTFVYFRKAFLNQLNIDEVRALNDIDSDDKENIQRRLSVYIRRMSAARPSFVADDVFTLIERRKY